MPDAPAGRDSNPRGLQRLWEAARRALGHLVTAARVREASLGLPPPGSVPVRLRGSAPIAGAEEVRWQPSSAVAATPLPAARVGASGADLAPMTTIVGLNAALEADVGQFHTVVLMLPAGTVRSAAVMDVRQQALDVRTSPVRLTVGEVAHPHVRLAAPAMARLPFEAPALSGEARRRPGYRDASQDALLLKGGHVRLGTAVMAATPLTRTRRPMPSGIAASAPDRERLAQASNVAPDDVVLLGVFPQVPVAAVRRLALEEGGDALSLWLKPEALAAAASGKSPRLATLVVGRQRSTGRMLQAVL